MGDLYAYLWTGIAPAPTRTKFRGLTTHITGNKHIRHVDIGTTAFHDDYKLTHYTYSVSYKLSYHCHLDYHASRFNLRIGLLRTPDWHQVSMTCRYKQPVPSMLKIMQYLRYHDL